MYRVKRDLRETSGGYWHYTCSSMSGRPMLVSIGDWRRAVRALHRSGPRRTFASNLTPTHDHLGVVGTRREVGPRISGFHRSAPILCRESLDWSFPTLIDSEPYLENTLHYIMSQAGADRFPVDHPALWVGSCFLDLIGARYLPESTLVTPLPWDPEIVLPRLGLPDAPIAELSHDSLIALGAERIVNASFAAACASPCDRRREPARLRAMGAAAGLGRMLGLDARAVSEGLGISCDHVRRLARQAEPRSIRATIRRLELEELVSSLVADGFDYDEWLALPKATAAVA